MTPEEWLQVSALFDQWVNADPEQAAKAVASSQLTESGAALLSQMLAVDDDPALIDKAVEDVAGNLLRQSVGELREIPLNLSGRQFGPWTVGKEIARGGMGAVFESYRSDGQFEQTAALKVIRPGAYSEHTAQRFADEMRTLARLEHANITRLIDGGISDDDISYFVMERVHGEPITAYADQQGLNLKERVRLLIEVCLAVEHAHQNLVVHGDLKPSNILVDEGGNVKLVDFGIAQSLKTDEEQSRLPKFTPGYASPEQASGEALTTRCDVFGLCAVLYELACGAAPRDGLATFTVTDYREVLSVAPPSPLARLNSSPDPLVKARHRQVSVKQLERVLRGDLKWVLEQGLSVTPIQRPASVGELRAELTRWLAGEAVNAHPSSVGYRLRRWAGRHKGIVIAVSAILSSIGVGTMAIAHQAEIARLQSARATWANEFLLGIFAQADPIMNQQQPITVNALTEDAAERILANPQGLEPQLELAAVTLLVPIMRNLGQYQRAADLSARQVALAARLDSEQQQVESLLAHGESLTSLDELSQAADLFAKASALMPLTNAAHPMAVEATQRRAMLLARLSRGEEAMALVDQLLALEVVIATSEQGADVLSRVYGVVAAVKRDADKADAALAALERALFYAEQVGTDSRTYADTLAGLAGTYAFFGDAQAAADIDREVISAYETLYGPSHPTTVQARSELAVSLSQLGRMREALTLNESVLAQYRASLGSNNQMVAGTLTNIGAAYRSLGQPVQAAVHYQESLAIWPRLSSPPPVSVAATQAGYGRVLSDLGRFDEGQEVFQRSLEGIANAMGADSALYGRVQCFYGTLLVRAGWLEQAENLLPGAYQQVREAYGEGNKRTVIAGLPQAELYLSRGRSDLARPLAEAAVAALDVAGLRSRHGLELARGRAILNDQ